LLPRAAQRVRLRGGSGGAGGGSGREEPQNLQQQQKQQLEATGVRRQRAVQVSECFLFFSREFKKSNNVILDLNMHILKILEEQIYS
jgi:hypothetical protein